MPVSTGAPILRFGAPPRKIVLPRRQEALGDKLWRSRGVLLVTVVPLLVVGAMVFWLFPSTAPVRDLRAFTASHLHAHGGAAAGGAAGAAFAYSIVLDAGSTGSRIHVFKFRRDGAALHLLSDGFHQLKPGLSAFAGDPAKAAESLRPLMAEALAAVPPEQQASTGLSLKATAGLRLLPGRQADDILAAVRTFLRGYPFKIGSDSSVEVMDGAHEGAFAWLTLNYLLGRLGRGAEGTVAAIDLGGGSVQEAFALPPAAAAAAPPGYVTRMRAGGVTYDVYVHSYLGYGLMAARAKVIQAAGAGGGSHPCFAKGSGLKYSYGGAEYAVGEVSDAGDFARCAAVALKALDHDKDCGGPQADCSFSGAWRGKPPAMARVYYVSSYFWDRALEAGIIADAAATEWSTSPRDFAARAGAACGKDPAELSASLGLPPAQAPFFCLDLSFCHTVLTQGFDLPDDATLTLVKQVKYNGQVIEAAWPLGAAIDELSSEAEQRRRRWQHSPAAAPACADRAAVRMEQQQPAAPGYWACSFAAAAAAPAEPVYCAWREFADGGGAAAAPNTNFLKGVRWSPDGCSCLTVSDDNWLRVFDLPQDALQHQPQQEDQELLAGAGAVGSGWSSGLRVHAGETVYDYAWFSCMSAADPASCCFASTARGQPIKVWDACGGGLRASYRAYDAADEITAATSLAFSPDGAALVGGYLKALRVFDVARPGRDCATIPTYRKRQEGSISGLISCLAFSPVMHDLLAAGSYSRQVGLFDARSLEHLLLLEGHRGGVTQVAFSPDGNFLYSGARQDSQIHCWDVRATGQVLYSLSRATAATNQRIGFSIEPCGRHLATGGCDGAVRVFDLRDGQQVASFVAAADTVNGCDFSPCLSLLATASGHRRLALLPEDGWEDDGATSEGNNRGAKRARLAGGAQQRAASAAGPGGGEASSSSSSDVSGLCMSSWRPGGMCNSLRLWRVQHEWVELPADAGDAGDVGDAGDAGDQAAYQPPSEPNTHACRCRPAPPPSPVQAASMGCITDVLCLPFKVVRDVCDCFTVILCCPCRCCCGCPSTSNEFGPVRYG
ncbi:APY2 [Scenedesmus sp. PABB004]|nr:APY2 [Scenedesmus sp. PABB004]